MAAVMKTDPSSRQLWHFFILTFLFSWLLWLPGVLITYKLIDPGKTFIAITHVLQWVAGMGPSLAALVLIIRHDGKTGLKTLWQRIADIRLGYWYVPALLLLPVTLVAAHLLNMLLNNASFPKTGLLSEPWWIPVLFVMFFVMQFAEELGWRGYALDRLQKRWSALFSSVLLGGIWAVWHVPMFFTSGFGHHDNHLPFGQFFLTLVFISILITWLQNNTNNSLIPALIIHTCINLSGEVLPLIEINKDIQGNYTAWILANILLFFVVIIVILFWGYKEFTGLQKVPPSSDF